jgi:hypothetical protein
MIRLEFVGDSSGSLPAEFVPQAIGGHDEVLVLGGQRVHLDLWLCADVIAAVRWN